MHFPRKLYLYIQGGFGEGQFSGRQLDFGEGIHKRGQCVLAHTQQISNGASASFNIFEVTVYNLQGCLYA